jgi:hypothetical protein
MGSGRTTVHLDLAKKAVKLTANALALELQRCLLRVGCRPLGERSVRIGTPEREAFR